MKKFISLMVLLGIISTAVLATPLTGTVSPIEGENGFNEDLFAEVQATSLSDVEMEAVEGDGILTAIGNAILNSVVYSTSGALFGGKIAGEPGAIVGGIAGGVFGAVYGGYVGYTTDTIGTSLHLK